MFLGLGQGRDRDQNFSTCWDQLEFGFKFYFLLEIILSLLSYFMGGIFIYFPNIISYTVQKFQLWRIITSIFLPQIGSFAVINVLFDFYLLYMCMPDVEKKNSTAYILLQVLLQVVFCNVVLVIVGYPFIYFKVLDDITLFGYGVLPVLFYFMWCKVALSPQQPTRFCFFPCLIPMKYIPLCLLALLLVFGSPAVPLTIYCFLGYYQTMIRKQSVLRLPLSVYRKIDSLMPDSVKEKPGYIKVTSVQANLKRVCLNRGFCQWRNEEGELNPFNNQGQNPYQANSNAQNRRERVQVIGGGVQIGGGNGYRNPQNQSNFKNYWRDKDQEQVAEKGIQKVMMAAQNRQNLQSDQQFSPDYCPQTTGVSEKALKRGANDPEMDNKSALSDTGLRTEQRELLDHDER